MATVSYRAAKCLAGAPPGFATFSCAPGSRTPGEILAHMGDLFDWALSIARGQQAWKNSRPLEWDEECARFCATLKAFDDYLASDAPLGRPAELLFQGPIADALTHTGQLAYLRRLAGGPIRGENYAKAAIVAGGIGLSYDTPRVEFD